MSCPIIPLFIPNALHEGRPPCSIDADAKEVDQ
jgi:hypothetical protein